MTHFSPSLNSDRPLNINEEYGVKSRQNVSLRDYCIGKGRVLTDTGVEIHHLKAKKQSVTLILCRDSTAHA